MKKYILKPLQIVQGLGARGAFNWLSDEKYLALIWRLQFNKKLNLANPILFTEKLQWLKLHDRKEEYVDYVDKYKFKQYITQKLGREYVIPVIAVYNKAEEIEWDKLPNQFAIKCTHGSHSNIICTDKEKLDKKVAIRQLNKWLKRNWFWYGREWPYKKVNPKIIIEEYKDNNGEELRDYKMMCFGGKVKCTFVYSDQSNNRDDKIIIYDTNWEVINLRNKEHRIGERIEKPKSYEKMVTIAQELSRGIPFARVDFFEVKDKPYVGELTLYPCSGFIKLEPEHYDQIFGSWIDLPQS